MTEKEFVSKERVVFNTNLKGLNNIKFIREDGTIGNWHYMSDVVVKDLYKQIKKKFIEG